MKKIFAALCAMVLCAFSINTCFAQEELSKDEFTEYLKNFAEGKLGQYGAGDVQRIFFDDYDNDNNQEMFVITGTISYEYGAEIVTGRIWYIDNDTGETVCCITDKDGADSFIMKNARIIDMGGTAQHLYVDRYQNGVTDTFVYEPQNPDPILSGGEIKYISNSNITVNTRAHLTYWFYWDGTVYREYGGISIT